MSGIFRLDRKTTKSAGNALFRWYYWREYTASNPAFTASHEGEVDRLKISLVYSQRKQEGLWWWIAVPATAHNKAVIRDFYKRKLKKAFERALLQRGLANNGTTQQSDGNSRATGLRGSLQILSIAPLLSPAWETADVQCGKLVDELLRLQSTPLSISKTGAPREHVAKKGRNFKSGAQAWVARNIKPRTEGA